MFQLLKSGIKMWVEQSRFNIHYFLTNIVINILELIDCVLNQPLALVLHKTFYLLLNVISIHPYDVLLNL